MSKHGTGKKIFLSLFFILFIFNIAGISAYGTPSVLPYDPELVKNQLPNGLTYYIKENSKPENRIVLRLAVNAGSINEEDHQKGLAHFLEHMAFNGTKSFPGNEIIDFLEKTGIRFGPDLNAYTGFDTTVYMLEIPSGDKELLDTAFKVLREWAFFIENDIEEIDKERGVVIEEWRRAQGGDRRISNIHTRVLLEGSKYAERQPIGDIDIIRNFTREDLAGFYHDWYRPDLMAVIAVGKLDPEAIEKKIKESFSDIPLRRIRKKRLDYLIPSGEGRTWSIVTDRETSSAVFRIAVLHDSLPQDSLEDYRRSIAEGLYFMMLNNRYEEIRKAANPPYLRAAAGYGKLAGSKSAFSATVTADPDDIPLSFTALLTELARVKQHGFTESELERAKLRYERRFDQIYTERDSIESSSLAAEYIRNFIDGEPVPGIDYEYSLVNSLLPGITLEELNNMSDYFMQTDRMKILLGAPEKEGVVIPREEQLEEIINTVFSSELEMYQDEVTLDTIIPYLPPAGEVAVREVYGSIGTQVFYLSGGAAVIVKPTDFRADEVLFTAFSRGGHSLAEDDEWASANLATAVVSLGRFSGVTRTQLDQYLEGRISTVSPYIHELEEGFTGRSSARDIETLFQLLHLYFAYPEEDEESYNAYTRRLGIYLSNQEAVPDYVYGKTLREILTDYHPRGRVLDFSIIEEVDLETAYSFFRNRFNDPADFTFIFTGSVSPELIAELSAKYLDSISLEIAERVDKAALSRADNFTDRGIRLPEGNITKTVKMGIEDKAQAALVFKGNYEWNHENNLLFQALASAAEIRLRNVIREDEGGTYSISVYPSLKRYPEAEYQLTVYFGTSTDRVDELKQIVFRELEDLKKSVPEDLVERFRNSYLLEYEKRLKENSFWHSVIKESLFHEIDPDSVFDYPDIVKGFTSEMLTEAAARYFDTESMIDIMLLPEEQKESN